MDKKPSLDRLIMEADIKKMWLLYFNNTLLSSGQISPEDHRKMQMSIAQSHRSNQLRQK